MVFKAKTFLNAVSRITPLLYGYFERIWRAVGTPSLGHLVKSLSANVSVEPFKGVA